MATVHEQLSEQFHTWERRGRGWQVFPEPVYPEPPFIPFEGHCLPEQPMLDDGRRSTLLSSFVQRLSRKLSTAPPATPPLLQEEEEPEPVPLVRGPLVEFQALLPDKLDIPREAFEQFLLNLSLCREPIAFELLGVNQKVTPQFAVHPDDGPLMRRQLQAYFPEAVFVPGKGTLEAAWDSCEGGEAFAVEFGLAREFMLPLASGKLDPFVGIIGALSELQTGELGLFQVLWQPAQSPWSESIIRSVTDEDGKPFFANEPELASAAETKVAKPLYAAVVRILIRSTEFDRVLQLARDLAGSLRVFSNPSGNELIPLNNDDYPLEAHIEDALCRQTRRSGMLLNSDELIGFVHLPGSAIRSPALLRQMGNTKAVPPALRRSSALLLGDNEHAGETVPVRLTTEQRVRHCHIIGASGTGKSTLLFNLIRQDIEKGEGVAVLDPHGDLVDRVLGMIPEKRIQDVVLVDPSDEEYSIGFNILSAHSELEKTLLASDLVAVFERLSTSWGDQMNSVLQNAILAFLESSSGGTIADVRRFLIEPSFRTEFLHSVQDSEVVYYWQKSFPHLVGNKSVGSILTRLDTFLSKKPIRYMVAQRENRLDFAQMMDSRKIFLAKLPEGLLGRENSYLLGALLVSKFQQLAMSRQAQQTTERKPFWIYIDEFANFITPSMAEILSGARKYRIGLTLAHHDLHQLERDKGVASAVMTHPCTRIVFRVGDDDARKLADGFSHFEAKDLRNLEIGQAVCRVERSDYDFNLRVPEPSEPDRSAAATRRQQVIAASRTNYSTLRSAVEALLTKSTALVPEQSRKASAPAPLVPADDKNSAEALKPPLPESPSQPAQQVKPIDGSPPPLAKPAQANATPTSTAVPSAPKPAPTSPDETLHFRTKEQIQYEAEILNYTVTLEEKIAGSDQRIDVVLRRGTRCIACEISVKNAVPFEVQNVEKCLRAGFMEVVVISHKQSRLLQIEELVRKTLTPEQLAHVSFRKPAEFVEELRKWAEQDPKGAEAELAKPHKQKINLDTGHLSPPEIKAREKALLDSLRKRMKGDGPG